MDRPLCPDCSEPMVLRTAKWGRNKGKKFWGCPNFPDCRETLDFERPEDERSQDVRRDESAYDVTLPKKLMGKPSGSQLQLRFFQSIAIPFEYMNQIHKQDGYKKLARSVAQWKLEIRSADRIVKQGSASENTIHVVAGKILTRGWITALGHKSESALFDMFDKRRFSSGDGLKKALKETWIKEVTPKQVSFDSPVKTEFYQKVLREWIGAGYHRWVTAQVSTGSLVQPTTDFGGYVDFLVSFPDEKPIVININRQNRRNWDREHALRDSGYMVFELQESEVKRRRGTKFNSALIT